MEIRDLSVSYDGFPVLNGLNLRLKRGEPLAVVGESGAGKTTLALSLMGLAPGRCTGEVVFKGRNLLELPEPAWRSIRGKEIAMVMQNVESALHPLYPALVQVLEAIRAHDRRGKAEAWEKARGLLRQVGITGRRANLLPHQLSGGEKQRVLLAMAIAHDPEVLILDEPTASLDTLTRAEVTRLLRSMAEDRMVLVVTHDLATAARLGRQMAVLYGGRVVELGPTELLMAAPRHPYTRGLLRSYPNMTTTKDLQGIPGRVTHGVSGCSFHPRCTQRVKVCGEAVPALHPAGQRFLACHRGGIVPLLELTGVSKRFGDYWALRDVSLTLFEGETLALVGESGSGKSTLAKITMGLMPASGGEMRLEGNRYEGRGMRAKEFFRRVQMIFQNPGETVSHRMTVLQAVKEPLDVQGMGGEAEKRERVKAVLAEVELPADELFLDRYPHQLSGGEKQRVAIARALILNPKLLIADEPTSALDASVQAKIIKLFLNLQEKRGLTILFITHDLALARKVSDRMAVLRAGEMVEEGPTNQLVHAPKHLYTKSLLAAAPSLTNDLPPTGVPRDFGYNCGAGTDFSYHQKV